jgi:hypothetical protein
MPKIIMVQKQNRVRCSDAKFLEAVYSSKTYAEIADKTGQKIASTIARYARVKKVLQKEGIQLPEMERKKSIKNIDNVQNMVEIVKRLKEHHNDIM